MNAPRLTSEKSEGKITQWMANRTNKRTTYRHISKINHKTLTRSLGWDGAVRTIKSRKFMFADQFKRRPRAIKVELNEILFNGLRSAVVAMQAMIGLSMMVGLLFITFASKCFAINLALDHS